MSGKIVALRSARPVADELSDRALLSAVGEGDQAALGALYDRYARRVYGLVARLLGPGAPAIDDVVQSTFLEAFRSARRYRGKASVRAWLFGIAANLARDHHRKESRRAEVMSAVAQEPTASPRSPHEQLELAEKQRLLDAAIETLTPALREAYVLCVVEELPGPEAARVLGVRRGTLWRRLHDARVALRRAIGEVDS